MTPAELRWCANGDCCASAPVLGGPARLSRSNVDSLCYACRERRIDEQLVPPSGPPLSLSEAAAALGVPRWRVEYLVCVGELRATKLKAGSRTLLTIAEGDLRALGGAS